MIAKQLKIQSKTNLKILVKPPRLKLTAIAFSTFLERKKLQARVIQTKKLKRRFSVRCSTYWLAVSMFGMILIFIELGITFSPDWVFFLTIKTTISVWISKSIKKLLRF